MIEADDIILRSNCNERCILKTADTDDRCPLAVDLRICTGTNVFELDLVKLFPTAAIDPSDIKHASLAFLYGVSDFF